MGDGNLLLQAAARSCGYAAAHRSRPSAVPQPVHALRSAVESGSRRACLSPDLRHDFLSRNHNRRPDQAGWRPPRHHSGRTGRRQTGILCRRRAGLPCRTTLCACTTRRASMITGIPAAMCKPAFGWIGSIEGSRRLSGEKRVRAHRFLPGLSATRASPDYGRVARHLLDVAKHRTSVQNLFEGNVVSV